MVHQNLSKTLTLILFNISGGVICALFQLKYQKKAIVQRTILQKAFLKSMMGIREGDWICPPVIVTGQDFRRSWLERLIQASKCHIENISEMISFNSLEIYISLLHLKCVLYTSEQFSFHILYIYRLKKSVDINQNYWEDFFSIHWKRNFTG